MHTEPVCKNYQAQGVVQSKNRWRHVSVSRSSEFLSVSMATPAPVPWNTITYTPPPSSSSLITFRVPKFTVSCSVQTIENSPIPAKRRKKPRPSFLEQVHDKWSRKPTILVDKLPWEDQLEASEEDDDDEENETEEVSVPHSSLFREKPKAISPIFPGNVASPPWVQGGKSRQESHIDIEEKRPIGTVSGFSGGSEAHVGEDLVESFNLERIAEEKGVKNDLVHVVEDLEENFNFDEEIAHEKGAKNDDIPVQLPKKDDVFLVNENVVGNFRKLLRGEEGDSKDVSSNATVQLPWESEVDDEHSDEGRRLKRSNTKMAEKSIPEPELRRLRNVSLRMVERIKVGAGGVTQALVDSIHEKWKMDEVVKLKFEGPPAMNMKRTLEILEVVI